MGLRDLFAGDAHPAANEPSRWGESVEAAVLDARRKLREDQSRLLESLADTVADLRDDTDDAVRQVRRRARRMQRRTRRRVHATSRTWNLPATVLAALAAASAIAVALAMARRSMTTTAEERARRATEAGEQAAARGHAVASGR